MEMVWKQRKLKIPENLPDDLGGPQGWEFSEKRRLVRTLWKTVRRFLKK